MRFQISSFIISSAILVHGLGSETTLTFSSGGGGLQLGATDLAPEIRIDSDDWPGVIRAARDLAVDFGRVLGINRTVALSNGTLSNDRPIIIAGTINKSNLIDVLIKDQKIDVSAIEGKWESYTSQLVSNPVAGVSQALVIAGSNKQGTIYGLYDISEQIGVSQWYWWADVPFKPRSYIFAENKTKIQGSPSIKFRGIFINDEVPALSEWAGQHFEKSEYGSSFTSEFYKALFELSLRSKANYIWPAKWSSMFYIDDVESGPLADYYGIYMGTSHHEPMARPGNEQGRFVEGDWDWDTNKEAVQEFMREGVERAKDWDTIYTMGMRGSGDASNPALDASTLEEIIRWQQGTIQEVEEVKNIYDVPQEWVMYKEVPGYWQAGMNVSDAVTLIWGDDNFGNLRRYALSNETDRVAGAGIYYYFDYNGVPRCYEWINTIQLQKTWEQMHLAYTHDTTQVWIVNVGDLKTLELPTNHFLDMAYDMSIFASPSSTFAWLKMWATREWEERIAQRTAEIMTQYGRLVARRK